MTHTEIKTRPDGSIDTAHYMNRGRIQRSEACHALFQGLARMIGRVFGHAAPRTASQDAGLVPGE